MSSIRLISLNEGDVLFPLVGGSVGVTLPDDCDLISRHDEWYKSSDGYPFAKVKNGDAVRLIYLHKLVIERMVDERLIAPLECGDTVDHRNGIRADARRNNLRVVPFWLVPRSTTPRGSVPYRGVSQNANGTYGASISFLGQIIKIGNFDSAKIAARAKDAYEVYAFSREFAARNFPDEDLLALEEIENLRLRGHRAKNQPAAYIRHSEIFAEMRSEVERFRQRRWEYRLAA